MAVFPDMTSYKNKMNSVIKDFELRYIFELFEILWRPRKLHVEMHAGGEHGIWVQILEQTDPL